MARILYVEDHIPTRTVVTRYLEDAGHRVLPISTVQELRSAVAVERFDLVLADLGLPDSSGTALLDTLRALTSAPTLVLTGDNTELTQCASLGKGADAYLCKPTSPRVVTAHVEALLRRPPSLTKTTNSPSFGPLHLKGEHLWMAGEKELPLSAQESHLLRYLVERQGSIVSRADLLHEVWGYPHESNSRVADETLRRLRIKLDRAESTVTIETLWGKGVRLIQRIIQ